MAARIRGTNPWGAFSAEDYRFRPLQYVRMAYIQFVQGLFKASPVGDYHWSPDPSTEIFITDENAIKADTVGKRPAITFTRGQMQFVSLGLDDMLSYDFATGGKRKSVLIPGVMSINCLSRVDIEAENIAWVVAENLWMNREMLMGNGFFEIGRQQIVTPPSPAGSIVQSDAGDGWFVCTVQSPFQVYRTSQISPLGNPMAAGIDITLNNTFNPIQGKGPLAPGPNLPYQVVSTAPSVLPPAASTSPAQAGQSQTLPGVPHPLNPSQMVQVHSSNPYAPGLRPPSIRGRAIPIQRTAVEESGKSVTTQVKIKV